MSHNFYLMALAERDAVLLSQDTFERAISSVIETVNTLFSFPIPTINYSNNRIDYTIDKTKCKEASVGVQRERGRRIKTKLETRKHSRSRDIKLQLRNSVWRKTHLRLVPSVPRERPSLAQWRHRGQKLHTPHQRQRYNKCEKKRPHTTRNRKFKRKRQIKNMYLTIINKNVIKKEEEKRCNIMAKSRA